MYEDHPFTHLSHRVKDILKPLKSLGVDQFSYLRKHVDGNEVYLSNNPNWIGEYYREKLYESSMFVDKPQSYQSCVVSWGDECKSKAYLYAKESIGNDHGFAIIKPNSTSCDVYFLSADSRNTDLRRLLQGNRPFIEQFCSYFQHEASSLLTIADQHQIFTPFKNHQEQEDVELVKKVK